MSMKPTDIQMLLAEGYSPEDIWVDGETASKLIGISKKTLDRWRKNGDFPQPRALGTRGLAAMGLTEKGNVRKSQVLRFNLGSIRKFMANEPKAGEDEE